VGEFALSTTRVAQEGVDQVEPLEDAAQLLNSKIQTSPRTSGCHTALRNKRLGSVVRVSDWGQAG
jgi:hypothetical protein